ncbi:27048_t:CDS:2, partial [Gigaspora margarita]
QADSNYLKNDLFLANSDNFLLKSQLYEIEIWYINFPDKQQKSTLLEKLDDILAIPGKIKGRGRPSGTKQLPIALEHIEAEMNKKKINASSLQNILAFHINVDDIDQVYNPKSDKNCGFRALAVAIRGNEENWSLVKLAMNGHLNKHIEFMKNAIFDEDNEKCAMFFSLESAPILRRNPIILHFVNSNHIVYVVFQVPLEGFQVSPEGFQVLPEVSIKLHIHCQALPIRSSYAHPQSISPEGFKLHLMSLQVPPTGFHDLPD